MKKISQLLRLCYINHILAKNGLDEIVLATRFFAPVRFLIYVNPWYWTKNRNIPRAERIRKTLEELGPIFIKFGQMLSTRRDLLPDDIASELARLQDKVPPFKGAKHIVEKIYEKPVTDMFVEFSLEPLASASVAQVHAATLPDHQKVVVKILRPNIEKIIKRDISLLYSIAKLLERYWVHGKRVHACDLVTEFETTILNELDLMREAANASSLRRNFLQSPLLYVPKIHWDYAREKVMVMERIAGIPISNIEELRTHNINLKRLAETGVEIFFTQVFRDCFFHGDMHPGNIFVSTKNPANPQYLAVDFGIMGSLSPEDQRYLAENMLAFFKRDYRQVAQLHIESGWVAANTRIDVLEAAIRTVSEPIFEKPLKDISFGHLLLRLFQIGRQFEMEVQPQLMLLQKTLLHIEGLGRQLYPELNLWDTAKPFLESWVASQMGPRALLKKSRQYFPIWTEKLPEFPGLIYQTIAQIHQKTKTTSKTEEHRISHKKHNQQQRYYGAKLGTAWSFIISGITTLALFKYHHYPFNQLTTAYFFLILGAIALFLALLTPKDP